MKTGLIYVALAVLLGTTYFALDKYVVVDDSNLYRRDSMALPFSLETVELNAATKLPDILKLADLKGRPFILNFWATWCKPCKDELPLLTDLWQSYKEKGVNVVGVAGSDTREGVLTFEQKPPFLLVLDPGGLTTSKYKAASIPETFLFDENGALLKHVRGQLTEIEATGLRELIDARLIAQKERDRG